MFKDNFVRICNQRGVAPSTALTECGFNASTYSYWTDKTVPRRATLIKLADYLNCSVDDLLADEPAQKTLPAEAGSAQDAVNLDGYPDYVRACLETALKIPPERREDFLRVAREIAKTFEPRE